VRPDSASDQPTVDGRHFRTVIGHLPSGVTVVTTNGADGRFGMTASSVTSLSADPPLMVVCLNNAIPTAAAVTKSGMYAVNILGDRTGELAYRFATPSEDKFAGVSVTEGFAGLPLLSEALAHLQCEVVDQVIGGTHSIFIGRVFAAAATDGQPLTYYKGGLGKFAHSRDEGAYRSIRSLVLERHYVPGERLTVAMLTGVLETDESTALYALTRLATDGLVERETDGTYRVLAMDARSSDAAFDARLVIELGVIDEVSGRIGDAELTQLRERFNAMAALLVEDRFIDFDAYLEANYAFHEAIVALAGTPILTAVFEGLAIKSVMTRSFGASSETSQSFVDAQRAMLECLESGDKEGAKGATRNYAAIAKMRARQIISERGGSL